MRPSEKLVLMLELNNFNIDSLLLKKRIDSELSGNVELHLCNTYSDLIISNYLYEENTDYTTINPLTYRVDSSKEVDSLDQLVIKHPDVGKRLTIKEFLSIEIFSEAEKRNILNDVIHTWLNEYKEARSKSISDLNELFFIITGENSGYRKPSKIAFILGFIFALFNVVLFVNHGTLQLGFLSSLSNYIEEWSLLLNESLIFSVFGVFTILLFLLYAFQNYVLSTKINGVMREKTSKAIKKIYKWDNDMNKVMSKKTKTLEKYVNLVIKKPDKSNFEMKKLNTYELILEKNRSYVKKVERKHDWMNKNYVKRMKYLQLTYIGFVLLDLAFIGLAFAIIRGLINV
jgi:hypothetical protein